jgi:hypothetical protein
MTPNATESRRLVGFQFSKELLPLDAAERVAVYRSRSTGKTCRHIFRRITAADWDIFFGSVRMEFGDEGQGPLQTIGMDTASLRLYSDAILHVDGFDMPDGRKPEEQPDWPRCVPLFHRLKSIELLMEAAGSATEKAVVADAKVTSVCIDALWNEGEPGTMKKYSGRVHRFRPPTAKHRQRLADAGRAGVTMTGTGRGKAVLPSHNAVLVALYDELIERTEGYAISGRELASKEEAVREMDVLHKAACINEIFPASLGLVN